MASRSDTILKLIATMKLIKGIALIAVACGALSLLRRDVEHGVKGWIDQLQPANHYLRDAIAKVSSLDPHTLRLLGVGFLLYAGLFLTEGIGLFRKKLWAEYLTTFITTSFIPIEVYEAVEHASLTKAAVIAANIAIVIYMVWRLRRDGHWPFKKIAIPTVIPGATGA